MIATLWRKRGWVVALLAGAMPLGTVADCGYTPGLGGSLVYDQDGGDILYGGPGAASVVVIDDHHHHDDFVYEEVYYEEVYYEDVYCDPYFDWDCWW